MSNPSRNQLAYLRKQKHHRIFVRFSRVFVFIAFLLLWEVTTRLEIIDSFIFSSPSKVAICFWNMVLDKSIFLHIGVTLYETLVSFVLVTVFSILLATLLWFSKKLLDITEPFLVILNSLPKSALAPLLIVWLGATPKTIIVAGMSVAIFGSIMSMATSFREVDPDKIKLVQTLGGNKYQALTKVVIQSCIPSIVSNMKVNIGLCLVGVIIGEFLAARNGLGYLIIYSSKVFKMDWLLMSIVILCILAMGLYALINLVEKLYQKYF